MNKKLMGFVIGLAAIALLSIAFFTLFKIEDYDEYFPPSREAQINEFLALDRWLTLEGYGFRVEEWGNLETLKAGSEAVILIQTNFFDWDDETVAWLDFWAEHGGSLILCLDYFFGWYMDDVLLEYLDKLGVEIIEESDDSGYRYDSRSPSFGRNMAFNEPVNHDFDGQDILVLKDVYGYVRLLQFSKGSGRITVIGNPRFMTSDYLAEEPNSRLSWYLLTNGGSLSVEPESRNQPQLLFIRGGNRPHSLLGRVFSLGNFNIIIIAGIILLVIGFWSAIPLFGVVRGNDEKSGKLLAERFLAEGRFLKRFGALDQYRKIYYREIRRRLGRHEDLSDEEIIARCAQLCSGSERTIPLEQAVSPGNQSKRNFVESIKILKTILERV